MAQGGSHTIDNSNYWNPHSFQFTEKYTEVLRSSMTCPRSHRYFQRWYSCLSNLSMVFGSHMKPKEDCGTQILPGLKTVVQSHWRDWPGVKRQGARQEESGLVVSLSWGHSLKLLQVSWGPLHSDTINTTVRRASISTPCPLLQHCLQHIAMQLGSSLPLRPSSPSEPSVHSLQYLGSTKLRSQELETTHYVLWKN